MFKLAETMFFEDFLAISIVLVVKVIIASHKKGTFAPRPLSKGQEGPLPSCAPLSGVPAPASQYRNCLVSPNLKKTKLSRYLLKICLSFCQPLLLKYTNHPLFLFKLDPNKVFFTFWQKT